jgi:plasmid maintenance system antidote protein VapI
MTDVSLSNRSTLSNNPQPAQLNNKIDVWLDSVAHKGGAVTGLAVLVSALILSFETLRHTAGAYGYGPWLSVLWPLLIDGIILSQSLVVLRRSRLGFPTRFNWFLLLVFEAASLFINAAAGWVLGQTFTEQLIGAMVHGLPPVALFLIAKSMSNDIKDNGRLSSAIQTVESLTNEAESIRIDNERQARFLEGNQAEINELVEKRDRLKDEVAQLQTERRKAKRGGVSPITGTSIETANDGKAAKIEARREQVLQLKQDGLKNAEIARQLEVTPDTIRRDVLALNGKLAEMGVQ